MASKKRDASPNQVSLFAPEVLRGPAGAVAFHALRREALTCQKCELAKERERVVFGEGPILQPPVAFVGEAPGEHEDALGSPFVGRAGQLLDRMIAAMGLHRDRVFVTNAVLCRPPENRPPSSTELGACAPYLLGQLRAVRPQTIVCLGKSAAGAVLGASRALEYLRGEWFEWEGIPTRVTFHPVFLLRPEGAGFKSHAWLDLKAVMERLGLPDPADSPHASARTASEF